MNRKTFFYTLVLTFNFLILISKAQYQNCTTPAPDNFYGRCVPESKCITIADYLSILKYKPNNFPQVREYITKANCGTFSNEKFICCERRDIHPSINVLLSRADTIPPFETDVKAVYPDEIEYHSNLKLLPKNCGVSAGEKISNGNQTAFLEFKFMALLQYEDNTSHKEFRCGGTLITARYVLTAAHCAKTNPKRGKLVSVRLGEYDLRTNPDCNVSEEEAEDDDQDCANEVADIPVESVIPHRYYDSRKFINDIALIRLKNEANFKSDNIRPICLPVTPELRENKLTEALIAGWGLTEEKIKSSVLLKAKLPVLDQNECTEVYSGFVVVQQSHLCAGGKDRVDACEGDSGGPLFDNRQLYDKSRIIQYGIVSAGPSNCGTDRYAGIYSNVVYYMQWILDNITE